jgi:hypothetical protein
MMSTEQQGANNHQRRRQQQFQACHLQILRSLHNVDGSDGNNIEKNADDHEQQHNSDDINVNQNAKSDERPVSSEIWGLIDRFIEQRREYLPQLQRQIHWNEMSAEAASQRDHFLSTNSGKDQAASTLMPSLTPQNLHFSAVKRRSLSTPNNSNTNNLSLTPLTNNRNALASTVGNTSHELSDISIPSWNFITKMVTQRQNTCKKSCDSFRSEPFLQKLLDEAKERCDTLEISLQTLKNEMAANSNSNHEGGNKGNPSSSSGRTAKRVKFDSSQDKCVTGITFFKTNDPLPEAIDTNRSDQIICEDAIMQQQIKLSLWLLLSKSVEQVIIDVK